MGKYRSKFIKHKRGGSHFFAQIANPTNWSGQLYDRKVLDKLIIGDIVRVIINDHTTTYVEITDILSKTHLKGTVDSWYREKWCNICRDFLVSKGNYMMCCETDYTCNYHVHQKCQQMEEQKNNKTGQKTQTTKCPECKQGMKIWPFQAGQVLVFKTTNISEIPNWTENTREFDKYLQPFGTGMTGLFSHVSTFDIE